MPVIVNGQICSLSLPQTLGALLRFLSPLGPFAVALNEEVIPRGAYEKCNVFPGDRIEIVHPAAGG
jgi:thiamine biosynthesis protein ThiS